MRNHSVTPYGIYNIFVLWDVINRVKKDK